MSVRVGVVVPQNEIGTDPDELLAWAKAVEAEGFHHLDVFDHVLGADVSGRPDWPGPYTHEHQFHEPLVLYGFLAGHVSLELATGVLVLPQRQTALVAKQVAELDVLSRGRVRLGVGIGWNPVEYEALGLDFRDRARRYEEQIVLLRRLWTEPVVDVVGEHHRVDRAGIAPLPAQALGVIVGTIAAGAAGATLARFFTHAAAPRAVVAAADIVIALFWLAWIYGIVTLDFDLYHAAVFSALLILAVATLDRFLAKAIACCRQQEAPPATGTSHPAAPVPPPAEAGAAEAGPAQATATEAGTEAEPAETAAAETAAPDYGSPRLLQILVTARRIVLAVTVTALMTFFVRLWAVEVFGLFTDEQWHAWREALLTAVIILVVGYILFELLRGWARVRFGHGPTTLQGDHDAAGLPRPAGRLASVLPLLEGFAGVLIVATAVLVALSHVGVNIGPILAGAGIFGLAFSFGSQALVRDIVSGIFFLADDAFRVGEYIQAGSHKGMVERISMRSLRIRHQNGQFHTIPYGQLGAVTNFSRDWATVKFNLRLARDVDVEQARKIAKKVGQELLSHEEYGRDFIGQLKMQGVADVQENALVCRFKFTVKPGRQALIQREAVKRLFKAFTENGVRFSSNAVVVQGGDSPASAAAAAELSRQMVEERAREPG